MKITEYYGHKNNNIKELDQIHRVKNIIIEWGINNSLDALYFFNNVNYANEGLGFGWNNLEWNGEIDLLALSHNHFIIFELKNKKGIIKGQTKSGLWGIKYTDHEKYLYENDYYSQCSRMKAFFSQNYWINKIQPKLKECSKLRPDVLLVFNTGSDLSNFKYTPPHKIGISEYKTILDKLTIQTDREFIKSNFHYDEEQKAYIINYGTKIIDDNKLGLIYNYCGIESRVKKWFHVITEDDISMILPNLGSNSFNINQEIVKMMVQDFNLIKANEHFV
jgi:hypothetical protein